MEKSCVCSIGEITYHGGRHYFTGSQILKKE